MTNKNLTDIYGIGAAISKRLGEQGIVTVEDLQKKTKTRNNRETLASNIKINVRTVYIWAKQADLMRVEGIDAVYSRILVESGVRHIEDLAAANTKVLFQLIESSNISYQKPFAAANLDAWKAEAAELKYDFVPEPDDLPLDLLFRRSSSRSELTQAERDAIHQQFLLAEEQNSNNADKPASAASSGLLQPKTVGSGFYFGLGEMIAEMGRGVAQAQHELDMSSLAVQQYIDADENLSQYGIAATWYALPETTFTIKVDYAVVKEETEEGEIQSDGKSVKGILNTMRIAPINAKYQNYFKSTASIESELKFKIVPVPPPAKVNDAVLVPDLSDLSVEEAKEVIIASLLRVGALERIAGPTDNGKDTQVFMQSKEAGTEAKRNDIISIAYYEADGEE
ncbi:MAG: DUF4332 domain-containing protein [Methanimicrococcus sp.]|nr:DUF4332 domain-containing protein [Methanimicrococcus sp.]